jgi:hypothetical protein
MKKYNIEPYKEGETQQQFYKEDAYLRAKKKLDKLKGFYWHLVSYIIINLMIIIMIGIGTNGNIWNFGTFATAFFWGIGLLFHFLAVFGPDVFFGKNWEERKIQEYMDKEKQKWE